MGLHSEQKDKHSHLYAVYNSCGEGTEENMYVLDVVTVIKKNKANQGIESDRGDGDGCWFR